MRRYRHNIGCRNGGASSEGMPEEAKQTRLLPEATSLQGQAVNTISGGGG